MIKSIPLSRHSTGTAIPKGETDSVRRNFRHRLRLLCLWYKYAAFLNSQETGGLLETASHAQRKSHVVLLPQDLEPRFDSIQFSFDQFYCGIEPIGTDSLLEPM